MCHTHFVDINVPHSLPSFVCFSFLCLASVKALSSHNALVYQCLSMTYLLSSSPHVPYPNLSILSYNPSLPSTKVSAEFPMQVILKSQAMQIWIWFLLLYDKSACACLVAFRLNIRLTRAIIQSWVCWESSLDTVSIFLIWFNDCRSLWYFQCSVYLSKSLILSMESIFWAHMAIRWGYILTVTRSTMLHQSCLTLSHTSISGFSSKGLVLRDYFPVRDDRRLQEKVTWGRSFRKWQRYTIQQVKKFHW